MAHMIDTTTGRAAMAYAGQKPWHGLGQELTPGASIATWTEQAGLAYTVLESPVLYNTPAVSGLQAWPNRKVLHRSDTGAPLAVVSDGYRVVQPGEVMAFMGRIAEVGGFEMETAGALSDGKRIWALARVNNGADVVEGDRVRPYVLLATSYDGSMATIGKRTDIRVVCNNTIMRAMGESGHAVRVLHSERFDPDAVRLELGIVADEEDRFILQARALAAQAMNKAQADEFLQALMAPCHTSTLEVQETKGYRRIMDLFENRKAIGSDIPGVAGTRWAMLNAVTEYTDHERGRSTSSRIESAWFGTGAAFKNKALELLAA